MERPETAAGLVEVPNLVGLTVPIARGIGNDAGLVVTARDLDGPALGALTWPGTWVVTAQDPPSGHRLRRADVVRIEFEKFREDGGA
ncbi:MULTISPECIES: PASTA domain-containing protein [unclassified Crossiella]|uniref:PASTA domain-containing protein n=1 Tax=unclassified Crossiella TaxID=2620835 RepID=UPI001FFEB3BD|nr:MULTISPECIES: PASTA domain-containing protein [unclassified Crossiella]MCK2244751.1 PASTA domain-containing protein [Crossiella sp. S99.2]MCK2258251.1 PASTA domain-containing protein [Crossiella sp. S99.1]